MLDLETDSQSARLGKRKRPLSTYSNESVAETLDPSMEMPIQSSHSAERLPPSHRHHSDNSALSYASLPKNSLSHRRFDTTAEISGTSDVDGGQAGNGDGGRPARGLCDDSEREGSRSAMATKALTRLTM
jgi:hypothetical protein